MTGLKLTGLFFFGALWGSFFYTLAQRFIDGRMKASPRKALLSQSACDSCGANINPLLLVPFIGFIIARGRCRSCGARISLLYPLAEIIGGAMFLAVFHGWGFTALGASLYLLIMLALAITVIDLKTLTIPDPLVIAFVLVSVYPIIYSAQVTDHLFGLLLMGVFFILILLIFPGSFGGGDVKFAAAIGLVLGLELAIVALETSLVTGALGGIVYALLTKKSLRSKIPFGPFLTAGLLAAYFYGQEILHIYYRFIR